MMLAKKMHVGSLALGLASPAHPRHRRRRCRRPPPRGRARVLRSQRRCPRMRPTGRARAAVWAPDRNAGADRTDSHGQKHGSVEIIIPLAIILQTSKAYRWYSTRTSFTCVSKKWIDCSRKFAIVFDAAIPSSDHRTLDGVGDGADVRGRP